MITLTSDEALVLFEWLSREVEGDRLGPLLREPADWVAVHRLLGSLESTLAEPFDPNYGVILDAARSRLRARSPSG